MYSDTKKVEDEGCKVLKIKTDCVCVDKMIKGIWKQWKQKHTHMWKRGDANTSDFKTIVHIFIDWRERNKWTNIPSHKRIRKVKNKIY